MPQSCPQDAESIKVCHLCRSKVQIKYVMMGTLTKCGDRVPCKCIHKLRTGAATLADARKGTVSALQFSKDTAILRQRGHQERCPVCRA